MKKYFLTLFFLSCVLLSKSQYITIELDNNNIDGLIPLTFHTDKTIWDSIRIYYKTDLMTTPEWLHTLKFDNVHYVDSVHCEEGGNVIYQAELYSENVLIAESGDFPDEPITEIDPEPTIPILDSISYINNQLVMGWTTIPDSTLKSFKIYKRTEGFYNIQEINDIEASYAVIDSDSISPCENQDKLILVAVDNCRETGNLFPEYAQALTKIKNLIWDKCDKSITIKISKYITSLAIHQEIVKHQVFVSKADELPVLLGEIDKDKEEFIHRNVEYGEEYTYFIRTFLTSDNGNATSTSCEKSITTEQINLPDFFQILYSSVIPGTNSIKTIVKVSDPTGLSNFLILRSEDNENFFQVAKLNWNGNKEIEWTDLTAKPHLKSYYYKAALLDECDNIAIYSENTTKTIHLDIDTKDIGNELSWNRYEGGGFDQYLIYRSTDGNFNFEEEPIATIFFDQAMSHTDFTELTEGLNQWSYIVKAISKLGDSNASDYVFETYSNIVTSNNPSIVRLANAFMPSSTTSPIFKPIFTGIDLDNYAFSIFNRGGQMIFHTTNPEEGWDGKYNGEIVQQGVYVYQVSYIDNENKQKSVRGTVVVVK